MTTADKSEPRKVPRSYEVRLLATAAMLDPRSARKALIEGPESLRGLSGVRARLAMDRLGLRRWEKASPAGEAVRIAAAEDGVAK